MSDVEVEIGGYYCGKKDMGIVWVKQDKCDNCNKIVPCLHFDFYDATSTLCRECLMDAFELYAMKNKTVSSKS